MFNFRPPNAPAYGFQIGPNGLPAVGSRTEGPLDAPSNDLPEAWKSVLDFAHGGGPRSSVLPVAPRLMAFFGQPTPGPDAPVLPNSPVDGDIQQVKDPLRCSGPNSSCDLPLKKRAPGVFLDPENPPFRLCQDCFRRSQRRPPTGDDT